ncbi:NUDIX domain-containing protein [Streptomyces sp. TP-A0874]|uniref:NUDIX domain-containing protein n=1 Tax=Streptomyces sp. TP-A0874 TaxID=549819 RepID=UPI00085399CE|nr:NUDIX domain-containing protein [Streptomyces sp. TP-A0874]
MPEPRPDSHCSFCGAGYPADVGWPRRCAVCGNVAYRNPLPVAVAVLPVRSRPVDGREQPPGLTVIRRTIEPRLGHLALPGGFIDHGEDWRQAVVRELHEETCIEAECDQVRLADVRSSPSGHLLVFGLLPERPVEELPPSVPTEETEGWEVLDTPAELAFPLHTEVARKWFEGGYAPGRHRSHG